MSTFTSMNTSTHSTPPGERLHYLDAVRAFALILGVIFHASLSFMPYPVGWAVMDVSTSPLVGAFCLVSHSFRMPLFFLIAGFFSHLSFHKRGTASFVRSRGLRLLLPFILGWFILWPLIVSGWIMGWSSMQGSVSISEGLTGGFLGLLKLPEGLFTNTHLWFLYYLAMITAGVVLMNAVAQLGGSHYNRLADFADTCLHWFSGRWWAPLALALPLVQFLVWMPSWGLHTPNTSLIPHLPTFVIYGGSFLLGWMLHRNPPSLLRLTRISPDRILIALLATGASIALGSIQNDTGHPHYGAAFALFSATYAVMLCSLALLAIGVARLLVHRPSRCLRMLADASFWIYLVHLPIVVWLQVAVAEWPLHWLPKLTLISILTLAACLGSYLLVKRLFGKAEAARPEPSGRSAIRGTVNEGSAKASLVPSGVRQG